MPVPLQKERTALEAANAKMIRQIAGLMDSTPLCILWEETALKPLSYTWLKQTATFWNNSISLPVTTMFSRVFMDAITNFLRGKRNWVSGFSAALNSAGYVFLLDPMMLQPIDIDCLLDLFLKKHMAVPDSVEVCPRVCPSQGVITCTYACWFAKPPWFRHPLGMKTFKSVLSLPLPASVIRTF